MGETVQVMVLNGGKIQFVDGLESERNLRVGMRIGDMLPAFVSSGGKAMLARLANPEREEMYRSGLPPWPTGKTTTVAALKRSMTKIRRDGHGTSFEETEQGVVSLGVSINDADERPVAAVTTAIPCIRFDRSAMPVHIKALQLAAAEIAEKLHGD